MLSILSVSKGNESGERESHSLWSEGLGHSPTSPLLASGRPFNDVYSSITIEFNTIFRNLMKAPRNKPSLVRQCYNALVDTLYLHATEIATNDYIQRLLFQRMESTFDESIDLGCMVFEAVLDFSWKNAYEKRYQCLKLLYHQAIKLQSKEDFAKVSKPLMALVQDHPTCASDFISDSISEVIVNLEDDDLNHRACSCEFLSYIVRTQVVKVNPALMNVVASSCSYSKLLDRALETTNEWYRGCVLNLLTTIAREYTYELAAEISTGIATQINSFVKRMNESKDTTNDMGMLAIISEIACSPVFSNAPWELNEICTYLTNRDWFSCSTASFTAAGFTVIRAVYFLFFGEKELYVRGIERMYGFLNSGEVGLVTQTLEVLNKLIKGRERVLDPKGLVDALLGCLHRLPHIPVMFQVLEKVRALYGAEMVAPIYGILDEYMQMQQRDVNFGKLNSLLKFMGESAPLQLSYFTLMRVNLSESSPIPILVRSLPLLVTLEKTNQLPEAMTLMFHADIEVRRVAVTVVASLCDIILRRSNHYSPATAGSYSVAASVAAAHLIDEVKDAIRNMLDVAVADLRSEMRLLALRRMECPFYPYLCLKENIDALFVALNDPNDIVSDEALKLLCVLVHSNQAAIHPQLLKLQEYLLQDLTVANVSLTFNLKTIHILTICADQYCLLLQSGIVENVVIHILSEQTFLSERFGIALLQLIQSILEHAGPYNHCDPNLFYTPLLHIITLRDAPPTVRRAGLETLCSALTTVGATDNTIYGEVYRLLMRIIRRGVEEPSTVKISAVKAISTIGAVNPIKLRKFVSQLIAEDNGKMTETQAAAVSHAHIRTRIHPRMDERYPSIIVYYVVKVLSDQSTAEHRHQLEGIQTLFNVVTSTSSSQRATIVFLLLPNLQEWLLDPTKCAMHDYILKIFIELAVLQRRYKDIIPSSAANEMLNSCQKFCATPRAAQPPTHILVIHLLDELAKNVPTKEMRLHRWTLAFIHQRLSQSKTDGELVKKVVSALKSFFDVMNERDLKLLLPHVLQCMEPNVSPTDERAEITYMCFHFLHFILVDHPSTTPGVFSQITLKLMGFVDESKEAALVMLAFNTLAVLFRLCRDQSTRFGRAMCKLCVSKGYDANYFVMLVDRAPQLTPVDSRSTVYDHWSSTQPIKISCERIFQCPDDFIDLFQKMVSPHIPIKVLKCASSSSRSSITFVFRQRIFEGVDYFKDFCKKIADPKSIFSLTLGILKVEQSMLPPTRSDTGIVNIIADNIPSKKNKDREQLWITWMHNACVLLVAHSPYDIFTKLEALTNRNVEFARFIFTFAATAYMQHLDNDSRMRMIDVWNMAIQDGPQLIQQALFALALFMESERGKCGSLQSVPEEIKFTISRASTTEKFGINYDEHRGVVVVTKVNPQGLGGLAGVPVGAHLLKVNSHPIRSVSDIRTLIEGLTTIELVFSRVVEKRFVMDERLLLDLPIMAKVAFESQHHSKALYFNEVLFERLFSEHKAASSPTASRELLVAAERLFEVYNHLSLGSTAQGVAKMMLQQFSSSVLQPATITYNEISILEQLNWPSQALKSYRERMLSEDGVLSMPAFIAVLRCQEAIGHIQANVQLINSYWETMHEPDRRRVAPFRARAAFWLGEWDDFDSVAWQPNLFDHLGVVERCAYLFRHEEYDKVLELTVSMRESNTRWLSKCLTESYGQAWDTLVTLRHLRHFEELVSYATSGPQRKAMLRQYWNKRLAQLLHRPRDLFTLLSINSLVLKPKEDYHSYVIASQVLTKVHWYDLASHLHCRLLGNRTDEQWLAQQEPDFVHAYIENLSATHNHEEAFNLLSSILSIANVTPETQGADKWGLCQLLLGEWMIRLRPEKGEEAILEIEKATALAPNNYAAFHSLGILHYDLSRDGDVSEDNRMVHYAAAITSLFRSVQLCSGSVNIALQDVLRILSIWFSNIDKDEISEAVHQGIEQLPNFVWLSVIPQLIARMSVNTKLSRTILAHLLIRVGTAYPHALIYPLTVAEKSPDIIRQAMAKRVLRGIEGSNELLVKEASLVSNELVRIAILSCERWHAAIQAAALTPNDVSAIRRCVDGICKDLSNAETPDEVSFRSKYGPALQKTMKLLNQGEVSDAWSILKQIYAQLQKQLEERKLYMEVVSPILASIKDTCVAVPGTFDHQKPLISIHEFHSKVYVMPSKQRPRRVGLDASNGRRFLFLLKGHEDMRQDERVMQFIGLIDTIFTMENSTSSLGLSIPMYAVVPLSDNVGVVGWVENTDTIYKLLETNRKDNNISVYEEVEMIMKRGNVRTVEDYHRLPKPTRVSLLSYAVDHSPDDELRRIMWNSNASSEEWLSYRNLYRLTLGAMSMVGYVLGLGDRHLNNLMLQENGNVVHIDFGDCFEVAMNRAHFAEAVPFRLTRLLVKALGVTGANGKYRVTCEVVMKNLRKHSENLLSILEAFIYDPLINWRLTVQSKSVSQVDHSGFHDANGNLSDDQAKAIITMSRQHIEQQMVGGYTLAMDINEEETRNEQGDLAWMRVKAKLTGHDFLGNTSFAMSPQLKRVDDESKLWSSWDSGNSEPSFERSAGNAVKGPLPTTYFTSRSMMGRESLDVSKQVDRLIYEATSLENLSEAFLTGWAPFW